MTIFILILPYDIFITKALRFFFISLYKRRRRRRRRENKNKKRIERQNEIEKERERKRHDGDIPKPYANFCAVLRCCRED